MTTKLAGDDDENWEKLSLDVQAAFGSLLHVTQSLVKTLRYERQISDELAALVWLLPDDPEGRRNAALDMWRAARD